MGSSAAAASPKPTHGRLLVVLAAILWSTSGLFAKVLSTPTALGLNEPHVDALMIAACRVFFAGAVMVPLLRRSDLSFRPALALTAIAFASMNALFISAMVLGKAANAILLQNSAPLWLYLVCVRVLGEPAGQREGWAVAIGLIGVGIIVGGGWEGGQLPVMFLGLGSGVAYAGILLGLRAQRDASPVWLTVVNHLFSAAVLVPFLWARPLPTLPQLAWLFAFGALQLGLPYLLMARALRSVSPQEAGTLTLLEPLLLPVWAFLIAPETETPGAYTLIGGACILGALAYRYWPKRSDNGPR